MRGMVAVRYEVKRVLGTLEDFATCQDPYMQELYTSARGTHKFAHCTRKSTPRQL
jgi:hypothetical protein